MSHSKCPRCGIELDVCHHCRYILPAPKSEIVCLCGSTRFKKEFEAQNKAFTREGYIVLSVGEYGRADGAMKELEARG